MKITRKRLKEIIKEEIAYAGSKGNSNIIEIMGQVAIPEPETFPLTPPPPGVIPTPPPTPVIEPESPPPPAPAPPPPGTPEPDYGKPAAPTMEEASEDGSKVDPAALGREVVKTISVGTPAEDALLQDIIRKVSQVVQKTDAPAQQPMKMVSHWLAKAVKALGAAEEDEGGVPTTTPPGAGRPPATVHGL